MNYQFVPPTKLIISTEGRHEQIHIIKKMEEKISTLCSKVATQHKTTNRSQFQEDMKHYAKALPATCVGGLVILQTIFLLAEELTLCKSKFFSTKNGCNQ